MPEIPEYDLLITADDSNMQIDDIEYTVEYISAFHIVGVQDQFLIKWVGFELDAEALTECAEKLVEFWQRPICKRDIEVHETI